MNSQNNTNSDSMNFQAKSTNVEFQEKATEVATSSKKTIDDELEFFDYDKPENTEVIVKKEVPQIVDNEIKEVTGVRPVINPTENQILGSVIYIDNFGNVVTNITERLFSEYRKGRSYTIFAKSIKFDSIHASYTEAINFSIPKENRDEDGKKIALFNAAGHLELSIYKSNPQTVGSASSLFGLEFRDTITIKFN